MGGHDQACAALGLGAVESGDVFLSAGTAWVLTLVTDRADVAALPSSAEPQSPCGGRTLDSVARTWAGWGR